MSQYTKVYADSCYLHGEPYKIVHHEYYTWYPTVGKKSFKRCLQKDSEICKGKICEYYEDREPKD